MSNFIEVENAENDLLACAALLAERISSADGHAASVSDVALRYAVKGELDLAAQLADTINDPHTRDVVLSEIAVRCVDFNDDEYGLQLVEALDDYGFQQQGLHNLALRQADNGRLDDALATAERIDDPFSTYGDIAARFAAQGDEARARELLQQIDFSTVRVQVLNEIASAKIKQNESPESVLSESLAETETIELPEEQVHYLLDIAARFLDANQSEKALETIEKATHTAETLEARFGDQAFVQIAQLYARAGEFEKAENALKQIEDLQQTASGYVATAQSYADRGDGEHAVASLEEAHAVLKSQPERQVRDSKSRFNLFATIAIRFARFEKPERGLEIALENPVEEPRHIALTNIAAICQSQDKEELARNTLNAIEDYASRCFALIGMSNAEAQKGNAEKAVQLLDEAHSLTEEINQLTLRSQALNEIAIRFAEKGDTEKAANILHESLAIAQAILDQSHQSTALANIAETYEKLNLEPTMAEREILRLIVRRRLTAG